MNEIIGREVSRLLSIYGTIHVMIMNRNRCMYNDHVEIGVIPNDPDGVFNQTYTEYYFSKNEEGVVVIFKVMEQREQTSVG